MTEQIQILQRRLECISRDLTVLWIALKSVFNEFIRKPSLGTPEKTGSHVLKDTLSRHLYGNYIPFVRKFR